MNSRQPGRMIPPDEVGHPAVQIPNRSGTLAEADATGSAWGPQAGVIGRYLEDLRAKWLIMLVGALGLEPRTR